MIDSIVIREASPADTDQILALMDEVFSKQQYFASTRSRESWNWKYEKNVFGKPIHILATYDERIVGFRSFWPWELACRGQVLKAYQPVDTVVHPDYQGQGLFARMNTIAVKKAIELKTDVLFNFSNQNSLPGNLKLGWNYVAKLPWLVKPLRPFHLLNNLKNKEKATPVELDEK